MEQLAKTIMSECPRCGNEFDESDAIGDDNHCPDCDGMSECGDCGEWTHSDLTEVANGAYICEDCRDAHYTQCEDCGEWTRDHDVYRVHYNERAVCENCVGNYSDCSDCGETHHSNDLNGDGCCESCADERRNNDNSNPLHDHWSKLTPVFHGAGPVFLGVELETDNYDDRDSAVDGLADLSDSEEIFYLEEDGSLRNGIEIVFHPADLPTWQKRTPLLSAISQTIESNGGESFNTSTCGIHVHRSRADLTEIDIAKLVTLTVKFERQICKIAQRNSTQWASFSEWDDKPGKIYAKIRAKEWGTRYVALNLNNEHTIEFRVFKGTLKIETIQSYIEFVASFCDWAKDVALVRCIKLSADELWADYLDYLTALPEYAGLRRYLRSKKLASWE